MRKTAIRPLRLVSGSVRTGRSLVHVRFDDDHLVEAINAADAGVFIAEHSYMGESFLRSEQFGTKRFVVNTNVSEALVWRATRRLLGRVEERRLLRDQFRVARAADTVGTYDVEEADSYRAHGVSSARCLDVSFPPAARIDIAATPSRLVFLGARDWPPNQEAFLRALALWPRISDGITDAELCIVGAKKPSGPDPHYPPGVRDLGFVNDLGAFLASCRALMAPVVTGGGVRVKLLDAVSRGLPVVATTPAIGSLGPMFGLTAYDDDDDFVAECRRLLSDRSAAVSAGNRLFEVNRQLWNDRTPHRAVEALLIGAEP